MTEKDKIILELKELSLTDYQFEKALERRLAMLNQKQFHQRDEDPDKDDGYCSACVL